MPVSVVAALGAGAAMLGIVHSSIPWRSGAAALIAAVAAVGVTVIAGLALDAAPVGFLVAMAAFSFPVLVLVEAAAVASGAGRVGRWVVLLSWALVVFPAAAVVPSALTSGCAAPECRIEDFGGVLPLVVSSAAFELLAALPVAARTGATRLEHRVRARVLAALAGVWVAFAVWLASLEGAVDEYIPRILLAAVLGPAAGSVGWALIEVLRQRRRPAPRSLALGLLAGMVAVTPSAASVGMPWLPVVGALAGALGALVFVAPASGASLAPRIAASALVAALVGFLAPAVSGESVGVIFSGQLVGLVQPVIVFAAVAAFAVVVSLPIWMVVRRGNRA